MKILVALDGSDAAFNALRSSCRLAAKTHADITAFYVNKGVEYSTEETGWTSIRERLASELESYGHEVIHKAYSIGKEFAVSMEGIIAEGIPTNEILRYVNAHGIIKLIAMGHSKGPSEFAESTTKNIVAQSGVPVFVTSSDIDIRNILVKVDDSQAAVVYGGRLAKSVGAGVGIVTFVPDTETRVYRLIAEVPNIERHIESSEKTLGEMMERAAARATDVLHSMGITASSVVKRGQSEDIIKEVKNYDLLIIGLNSEMIQKRISRTAGKLLNTHGTNIIFVQ